MDSYEIYVKKAAFAGLDQLRGSTRRSIEKFIDYLSDNPFDEGDFPETDSKGREIFCKIIRDHAITYYPDHAVKELKILEITTTL